MKTEIVIMNKWGIALAADSAVTISLPDGTGFREKVFSTNKLFMLSKYHPVGIMIYGNATLMGIPWELIIKEYRKRHLGNKSFASVKEYCEHFIDHLNDNLAYFPADIQQGFVARPLAQILAWIKEEVMEELMQGNPIADVESFHQARADLFDTKLEQVTTILENQPTITDLTIDEEGFQQKYGETILEETKEFISIYSKDENKESIRERIRQVAYLAVVKDTFGFGFQTSGIVIAGYGENSIHPSLVAYDIEGVFDDRLKYVCTHERCDNPSAYIVPFAQGEMIKTFMDGVSPEYQSISENYLREILVSKFGPGAEQTVEDFKKHTEEWISRNASSRIINAVQSLPVGELASMAETLVNLTSFKLRVTPDLETVGGPIDVAVITKGDGFVWIERKHYFDAEKNPHFMRNYYRGDKNS